jgi:hypothetical protein
MSDTQIRYTPAVGSKFNPDGSIHTFAGNTVICYTPPDSHAYQQGEWVQDEFRRLPIAHKYALMPPSSFHMTVFELINHSFRNPVKWPQGVALDTPLEAMDQYFIERVPQVETPENFRMRCTGLRGGGILIKLAPADDETEQRIWAYRRALAAATQLHTPDFDQYGFHMTLAYRLIELEPDEEQIEREFFERVGAQLRETWGIFDTGKPHLTFFDDMYRFVTVDERHTLKTRAEG